METLVKADIFFFITAIAVVLLTAFFSVALFYLIRILRNVDEVAREVKGEAKEIVEDMRVLRRNLKEEGLKVRHIFDFMTGFLKKTDRRKASARTREVKAE